MSGKLTPENSKDVAVKDLAEALKTLVEKVSAATETPKKKSWLPDWTNTPFFVTVLGGMLLSLTTLVFQSCQAHYNQNATDIAAKADKNKQHFQQEIEDRKHAMLDFVNGFPAAAFRLYDYEYALIWLQANIGKANAVHESGRNFSQMWVRFETNNDERLRSAMPESFPAQISTVFTNADVLKLVDKLQNQITQLSKAESEEKAGDAFEQIDPTYQNLSKAMGQEISSMRRQFQNYENSK